MRTFGGSPSDSAIALETVPTSVPACARPGSFSSGIPTYSRVSSDQALAFEIKEQGAVGERVVRDRLPAEQERRPDPPSPRICKPSRIAPVDDRAARSVFARRKSRLTELPQRSKNTTGSSAANFAVVSAPRLSKPKMQLPKMVRSRETGVIASPIDETLSATIGSCAVFAAASRMAS